MKTHKDISFTKVALPFGWLGNMSPFPVEYNGKVWRTTEALFQALRFEDEDIIEAIRLEKSPMGAKMKAKGNRSSMVVEQLSDKDIDNMIMCINLKLEQHPHLKDELLNTDGFVIVEDVTSRPRGSGLFWGAAKTEAGNWDGRNILGKIWMDARDSLKS
jgi:ribA/ribD-fused uncharacterized protein